MATAKAQKARIEVSQETIQREYNGKKSVKQVAYYHNPDEAYPEKFAISIPYNQSPLVPGFYAMREPDSSCIFVIDGKLVFSAYRALVPEASSQKVAAVG